MAALGSQSIASSYEQLLHVDADGGGNGTTHVSVKDGDNGTTFGFTIASDALMMTSTNRLEFGDNGTYIHQSADGVLDLVSDTEIELNGTIDINGAVTMDGGNVTINDDSGDYDFRVESNGDANMLFVDGGNDRVGIGVVPSNLFHVEKSLQGLFVAQLKNSHASDGEGLEISVPAAGSRVIRGKQGATTNVEIEGDGDGYNTNGTWGTLSDESLKENIAQATSKLDDVNKLQVRNFNFIDSDMKQIGFIAQEFEKIFPSMVSESKEGIKRIKTSVLIPCLVKAIQELSAKVDALEG